MNDAGMKDRRPRGDAASGVRRRLVALAVSFVLVAQAMLSPLASVVAYAENEGVAYGGFSSGDGADAARISADDGELRIAVLSDMHYYPVNFVSDCADYTTYVGGDPKMLEESGSIADAALEMVREDDPDILIVSGDLTKDGEIQGHRDLAAKFQELEDETETEVFVINGNHDIYNYEDACTFENGYKESAQTTTPDEFKEIYANFGYNGDFDARYFANPVSGEQAGELSYAVDLGRFTIVAIDSGMYSPDAGTGYDTNEHITAGRVDEDLLPWVTERVREADGEGDTVIGLMHHGLVPHFEGEEDILSEYVVEDWQNVATELADAGMRYIFTGHMHANDIAEYTTVSGNRITDLETGSLSSWKSPMRTVTVAKGEPLDDGTQRTHETFTVSSRGVTSIDFTDHTGQTTHIDDFLAYTQERLYPETLFNNMANGMLRPMLQEIGQTGLRQWIAENLPDIDLDATILDLVRGALAGGMDIELGTGIGRVHVEYRNGGVQLSPSGTAGLIGDMTITDAQLLRIVYDVLDKIEARYIDDPDWLLGQVDQIVTRVSNYGLSSLDGEQRTIYDLVLVILTGHYAGSENPPAWAADAVATIRQGDIVSDLIVLLVDDVMPILDDVLANTSIDTGIAFSGLWKTAIDSVTDDGNLKATLETFGFDETAIRGLIDGLINEYMSPSFLTGMGNLVGDICDSMLYDTNGADDAIGGEGRTITFDGATEAPAPSVENGLLPTQVTMTLGADPTTSRNIRWYTGTNVTQGTVQVATDAAFEDIVAEVDASSEEVTKPRTQLNLGLVTTYGTQQAMKHSATVTGLAENADYFYRVGDAEHGYWSDAIAFTTGGEADDADAFTFIDVNDSQGMVESDYDVYLNTLSAARGTFPDAAFTIHGGDFVDDGANEDYWTWALDDDANVAQGMAMAPAAGNHEARSDVEGITDANPIISHFNLANVPEGQDLSTGVYYSFEYQNATFAVLNTNDLGADGGISQEQYDWAYQTLSAADTEWRIVLLHKSPYSNGPHQADGDVVAIRAQMDALAAACDVDVVLSGHDHVYNRTPYLVRGEAQTVTTETQTYQGTNYETAVNPNGCVFIIAGTCGVKNYAQDTTGGIPSQVALDLSVPVYTGFTIDGDHLYYRAYSVNGDTSDLVDSFAISKAEEETPAWKLVEEQIAALPEQSEVALGDAASIEAAREAYDGLSAEDQSKVSNLDRLVAAERMLALLQDVDGKRTVTVSNHDDFTAAINDPGVGTIITQGTIEFDEGGLFDDGDREIYISRDVVVRGTGELRYCRFHVQSGATLVLADSVYVNNTRSQGSFYDALNPVEVNGGGTLITQDSVSLRTEYGTGGSDEGVAVKLMGAGATAILGSSGTYWGSEAAVLSTASGTTLVINDGTYNAKNSNRVVIDTHGDATVNGGTISSMWISGTLRVNGGTFEHQDSASSNWTPLAVSGGDAYITGGTFESYNGRDGNASIKLENGARLHILADTDGAVRIGDVSAYVGSPSTTDYENVRLGYVRANGWNGSEDGIYRVDGAVSASSVEEIAALGGSRLSTDDVSDNGSCMTAVLPDGTSTVFGRYWLYGGSGGKGSPAGSGIIGSGDVIVYGPVRTIQNNPVTGVTIDGDATRLVDLNQEGADTLHLTGYTTPANAFDNGITWSSDDAQTASVEELNGQGVVTIKQAGGANITATSDSNQDVSASVEVIAVRPELAGADMLDEGVETATYTAGKGFESDAYDTRLTWRYSVDDQTLATIDAETGVLTKVKPGAVVVTATLFLDGEATGITVSKSVVLKGEPEAPAVEDVNALLDVQVADVNEDMASEHAVQTFETLIANSEGANDSYTIGEVYSEEVAAANPLEEFTNFLGITRAAKVYKVDVTIQAAPYVAAFDKALGLEAGTHELEGDKSVTVTLVWSDGDPSAEPAVEAGWTLADPDAATVFFEVMCRGAQAAPVLTVTPGATHATVTVAAAEGTALYGDIQWADHETDWSPNTFQTLEPGTDELEVSESGTFYFRAAGDAIHDPSEVASVSISKVSFDAGEGAFAEGSASTWFLADGTAVGADNMPAVTRDGYVFAGWQTADSAAFDGTTAVSGEMAVTAQWTQLATIAVTPDEGNTACTYDGSAKTFGFTVEPEGVAADSFTVEYRAADADETDPWTGEAPVNAGTYDVRVTRGADGTYEAYSQLFEDGLVIAKATYATPSVLYSDGEAAGSVRIILQHGDADMYYWSESDDLSDALEAEGNEFEVDHAGTYYVFAPADGNHNASEVKEVEVIGVTFDDGDGIEGDENEGAVFTEGATEVLMAPGHTLRSWGGMPKVSWDGHELLGWVAPDGSEVTDLTAIEESMTLTAQWNPPAPEPGPVTPTAPTAEQVSQMPGISVSLHGVNELNSEDAEGSHPDVTYAATGESALIAGSLTVAEPVQDQQTGAWTVQVTLDGGAYLDSYSGQYGEHYFADPADQVGERTFALAYNETTGTWAVADGQDAAFAFDITCLTLRPANAEIYVGGESDTGGHFVDQYVVDGQGNAYTVEELNALLSGQTARIAYFDEGGAEILDDTDPGTYEARIVLDGTSRSGEQAVVTVDGEQYVYALEPADLVIRSVSDSVEAERGSLNVNLLGVTDAASVRAALAEASGGVVASLPAGTTVNFNGDADVALADVSGVTLLSDDLLPGPREGELVAHAEEQLGVEIGSADTYDFQYLDLVDENQSNAWVSSSLGTDVYWRIPEGADASSVRVYHFAGLHRDYDADDAEVSDLIEASTVETVSLQVDGENGFVSFHVDESGFSPFLMTWEQMEDPGTDPEPDPDPEPEPGDSDSGGPNGNVGGSGDIESAGDGSGQDGSRGDGTQVSGSQVASTSDGRLSSTGDSTWLIAGGVALVGTIAVCAGALVRRGRRHRG